MCHDIAVITILVPGIVRYAGPSLVCGGLSLCIDAGRNAAAPVDVLDLDGDQDVGTSELF
ncbi:MAG: hypothetical protein PVJ57_08125 [Phycisphaerae bacterium]